MLAIARTPPFRRFQRAAGISTFHINTVVVGLELVAKGAGRPNGLNINWQPPQDARSSVEQTKKFVLLAILAHVVDAFEVLLRDYADLRWTSIGDHLKGILRKSVTKPGGGVYSIRERAEALVEFLRLDERDALSLLDLMVEWRNAVVHARRARHALSENTKRHLSAQAPTIADKYASIDIERAVRSFEEGAWPTLKESTTLVAACQNLAGAIDIGLLRRDADTSSKVKDIAILGLSGLLSESETMWKSIAGKSVEKRRKVLIRYLNEIGITEVDSAVSAALESQIVFELARSPRRELESMFTKTGFYTRRLPKTDTIKPKGQN